MVAICLAALVGIMFGSWTRHWTLALAGSMLIAGGGQLAIIGLLHFIAPTDASGELWRHLHAIGKTPLSSVFPTFTGSGVAALIANLLPRIVTPRRDAATFLDEEEAALDPERKRRMDGMIEERPIHALAEQRIAEVMRR